MVTKAERVSTTTMPLAEVALQLAQYRRPVSSAKQRLGSRYNVLPRRRYGSSSPFLST
uniref:Uncharacterized protein n=1 Tax=Hyaloperonospora arabidopsidis (strain Emoy2) TaxID=559515 RepID=M4C509_HYAAE